MNTTDETSTPVAPQPGRVSVTSVLKWTLLTLVLGLVVWRARTLWLEGRQHGGQLEFSAGWLLAAAGIYLVGWLPSLWYWRRLLADAGHPVSFPVAARAYFCGHLGKYVPGKAAVLVIRAALLKPHGVPPGVAALTATWEALVLMGVGGVLGVALAPSLLPQETIERLPAPLDRLVSSPLLLAAGILLLALLAFPLVTRLVTRVAAKMAGTSSANATVSTRRLLIGVGVLVLVWICHGLSLGWTLQGLGGEPLEWSRLPGWTAAVGLATAIGFVALFAPGGVGVREGLMIESLAQAGIAQQQAVAASIVLRGIWLAAEIGTAAVLYYSGDTSTPPTTDTPEPSD